MTGILAIPKGYVAIAETQLASAAIIQIGVHLGCTNEVSSFTIVINNGLPDSENVYSPGEASELTLGAVVTIKLGRQTTEASNPLLLTGKIEEIEYIEENEEYGYRDTAIISGRCKGYQLFEKHFNGDLITTVGTSYKNYKRTSGDASSLVAYIIDNYTSLTHSREEENLSGNASSGQKVVAVDDGSTFSANDLVKIIDDTPQWEYNKIASIDGNNLTMTSNLVYTYTTAANAKVERDLIEDSETSFLERIYNYNLPFDIIKEIANVTSNSEGAIGYDFRIEYDGEFAFFSKESKTESYVLEEECQIQRKLYSITPIKNDVYLYGKNDKPFPVDTDGQTWSDAITESLTSARYPLTKNATAGQDYIVVSGAPLPTAGQKTYIVDDDVYNSEFKTVSASTATKVSYLSYDAEGGQKAVRLSSTTGWAAGDKVTIDDNLESESNIVASVYDSTTLLMTNTLSHTYTVAEDGKVTRWNAIIFTAVLSNSYTTANFSIAFKVPTTGGWGYIPFISTTQYTISLSTTVKVQGSYSIKTLFGADNDYAVSMFLLNTAINLNDYAEIILQAYFDSIAPSMFQIILFSGDLGSTETATSRPLTDLAPDEWTSINIGCGEPNKSLWNVQSAFDWTDVKIIGVLPLYDIEGTYTFYIDRMYIFGTRWVGHSEDATSQSAYGTKEYVEINDNFLDDAGCLKRSASLLAYYKDPRTTYQLSTRNLDWSTYNPMAGNKVTVDYPNLSDNTSYRIDCLDITFNGDYNGLDCTFTLDNTPFRFADYISKISKDVRTLRNRGGGAFEKRL